MNPKLALAQAGVALALLVGLPVVLETPESTQGTLAAAIGALVLAALAVQGMIRFVRSRKPRSYADSMMLPPAPGERKPPTARKED